MHLWLRPVEDAQAARIDRRPEELERHTHRQVRGRRGEDVATMERP